MSNEIRICHCGYTENNHNFRHEFKHVETVIFDGEKFVINADSFPVVEEAKCSVEQCGKKKNLHGKFGIILHDYTEGKFTSRNINFAVPENTQCVLCDYRLSKKKHPETTQTGLDKVDMHSFTVKIDVKNKQKTDNVFIVDSIDDDRQVFVNSKKFDR
jgi:hypothetical protein